MHIEGKICNHNSEVMELFPCLSNKGYGKNSKKAILPSNVENPTQSEGMVRFARAEIHLRVGLGHDILHEIRLTTSLHHYYSRRQKKSRSRIQVQQVSQVQSKTAKAQAEHISNYIFNWKALMDIFSNFPVLTCERNSLLKGLQQLNKEEDVKFFEEWGNQATNFSTSSNLNVSWIWRVAMEGQPNTYPVRNDGIKRLTDSWESEGSWNKLHVIASNKWFTARRLHWLHLFSRNERWKEEVLLVSEEIRRVGESYRVCIGQLKASLDRPTNGLSWVDRGYRSLSAKNLYSIERLYAFLPLDFKAQDRSHGSIELLLHCN